MSGAEELQKGDIFIRQEYDNIIKETRKLITNMSQKQRFQKAKSHVMDALNYKEPQPMSNSPQLTRLYYLLYTIQSSSFWSWLIFVLSFCYMYLVILDNQSYVQKISTEAAILVVFITDSVIDFYTRSFDRLKVRNRYPRFHYFKAIVLGFMLVDLIIFVALPGFDSRPIRPFRLLRALLPVLYDSEIRRSLIALASAYRQLFSFIIYYSIIIFSFAFIGSQALTFDLNFVQPNPLYRGVPQPYDQYINNYNQLSRMIYHMYGVATYDFYPDFQILAVQNFQPNYIFYIIFIFFNMFLFSSIPGAVIYNKVRQTRSRYIIFDQIRQQHSLILAFVALAKEDLNLSMDQLVKFLFYFYRSKTRYVQYITQICLILDDNNNQTIQVNEFMQLSKLILYNSVMFPPRFDDVECWLSFRKIVNENLYLQVIIQHWAFDVVVSIITLLCSVNAILLLFEGWKITQIFDTIFIWLYFSELLVRLVGIGPETYFAYRWNQIDSFLIMLNVVFFFVSTNNNIDNLFKISRIFRVAFLFRTLLLSQFVSQLNSEIIQNFKRLFETFAEIFPIITRFFLIFAIFFFIFGILGMQIFYQTEQIQAYQPKYTQYVQFSNFLTFIHSQYIMMQILTQGGWSKVTYNYCWRNQNYYGFIVTFFMFMHFAIVFVLATLLKGIFWEIYFTVAGMLDDMQERVIEEEKKDSQVKKKSEEINQITQQINQNQSLQPDSIIKREIIEMKMDMQFLKMIREFEREGCEDPKSQRSFNRSKLVGQMMENWNIDARQLERKPSKKQGFLSKKLKRKKAFNFEKMQDKQQQDLYQQMQDLLNRLIINPQLKYSYLIAYPRIFVSFLNQKFTKVQQFIANKFDIHLTPLQNEASMQYHMYEMSSLVQLQPSERQRKELIVECLISNQLIDEDLAEKIIKTKLVNKRFHIDSNGALKKMYLSETNEDLIKKLQVQYFSDVYGHTFKQINKVSLQPLLKVQSNLTYTFWNILSYPQIHYSQFFHFLTFIQNQISTKLIKRGSLFKFVYKLSSESDIWFMIERKRQQDVQVRFIKTGLWTFTHEMEEKEIYYARDVFKWDSQVASSDRSSSMQDSKIHQQYMKLFFESFETLAFSLIDKKPFFESNPKNFIYDLYCQHFQVGRRHSLEVNRRKRLKISNIMLVVLCKQQERTDIGDAQLPYRVSDIKGERRKRVKEDFLLEDQQKQTFQKLKDLSAMDHEKIIQTEGLPFSYIINLMKQMSDYLQLYSETFVSHVEKALNEKSTEPDGGSILLSSDEGSQEEEQIQIRIDLPLSQRELNP